MDLYTVVLKICSIYTGHTCICGTFMLINLCTSGHTHDLDECKPSLLLIFSRVKNLKKLKQLVLVDALSAVLDTNQGLGKY